MKKLRWMALDNAAKIFPAAMRRHWSNVFRVSATLIEDIDSTCLQSALERAIKRCPSIGVRIRAGFFWYYIQELPHAPQIQEEKPYPISRMPFDDIRDFSSSGALRHLAMLLQSTSYERNGRGKSFTSNPLVLSWRT